MSIQNGFVCKQTKQYIEKGAFCKSKKGKKKGTNSTYKLQTERGALFIDTTEHTAWTLQEKQSQNTTALLRQKHNRHQQIDANSTGKLPAKTTNFKLCTASPGRSCLVEDQSSRTTIWSGSEAVYITPIHIPPAVIILHSSQTTKNIQKLTKCSHSTSIGDCHLQ